ncbi:HNH endonuclease [Nostoc sp.]
MPQSLGGSDELDNLALACHRCNDKFSHHQHQRLAILLL